LIKNRVLTSIELEDNYIDDEGCLAIVTMLFQNTVLTKIMLSGNDIGPTGAAALAGALIPSASKVIQVAAPSKWL
jgi:Ran GTPase-activating protein (RanGAP) involved in mRNA processing and transport